MKRCPRCNQEFTDEWLTFCTQDGTSLVDVEVSPTDPPPTLLSPAMPPSVSPNEQPTLDLPGTYQPPPTPYSAPRPLESGWTPPPPPPFPSSRQQGLAVTSLILGIVSMTLGLCCYFGILTGPAAVVLGIIALVQIKNEPTKYSGKGIAIAGIVTGGLYFVALALIILFYGVAFMSGAIH
jgi:hypothetical protein